MLPACERLMLAALMALAAGAGFSAPKKPITTKPMKPTVPGKPPVPAKPAVPLRKMLEGAGAEVDPGFPYYANRSAESIASEVALNGYRHAHYVVTSDSGIRPDLIRAFHAEKLPVWYLTFGHVAYGTGDFPAGWESWRMKLRASAGNDFTRLCMNNPDYVAFKAQQVVQAVTKYPFDGVEIVEPFWPDVPGPTSPTYGCLCDYCQAAFLKDYPEETDIPEFTDTSSPRFYKKVPALYQKWVTFRVRSIGRFLNTVVTAAREARPGIPVMAWSLAQDAPNAVALLREAQGNDAADMATLAHPDAICFQTNWTDWSKENLPPDYLAAYRPFLDNLRAADPTVPVVLQVDTGSLEKSRQTYAWMSAAEKAARQIGAMGIVNYEYFITKSMYDDPPRLLQVRRREGGITLAFQKRVDAGRAGDVTNYRVTDKQGNAVPVTAAQPDGNLIHLTTGRLTPGQRYTVTCQEITDTPDRWLFKGYPAHFAQVVRKSFTR